MATPKSESGVTVDLGELVRLQYQARGFAFLPRQPMHSALAGKHVSRLRGRGLNFQEIRAYVPGDDVRMMDWRVTARLRTPHVRIYNEERDRCGLLLVDQRKTMFFGSEAEMKSVTAAKAAALGAWRILSQEDRVGAIVFDDDEMQEVKPLRSRKAVMQILRQVALFNQRLPQSESSGTLKLNDVLKRASQLATHDWLITVISDFIDADEETQRLMTKLAAHNDVIVVYVHDRLEKELPAAGRLVIAGDEGQIELNSDDAKLRSKFAADHEQRLGRARSFLLQRAVPVLSLDTSGEVALQIRSRLGHAHSMRKRSR